MPTEDGTYEHGSTVTFPCPACATPLVPIWMPCGGEDDPHFHARFVCICPWDVDFVNPMRIYKEGDHVHRSGFTD